MSEIVDIKSSFGIIKQEFDKLNNLTDRITDHHKETGQNGAVYPLSDNVASRS